MFTLLFLCVERTIEGEKEEGRGEKETYGQNSRLVTPTYAVLCPDYKYFLSCPGSLISNLTQSVSLCPFKM
jgi:hypothetical protein